MFFAYVGGEDPKEININWWIKEDGIYRSYNNLFWERKAYWTH